MVAFRSAPTLLPSRRACAVSLLALLIVNCRTFEGVTYAPPATESDAGPSGSDASTPEPPSLRAGSGKDGPLEVSDVQVPNRMTLLAGAAAAASTELTVEDPSVVAAGDVVMVWSPSGLTPVPPRATAVLLDSASSVGRYALARVASVSANTVVLADPIAASFPAGSEVVRVPQYTDVHVLAGGRLGASRWDGKKGGIVAFLASGKVLLDGDVDASGAGFRGGAGSNIYHSLSGCIAEDSDAKPGFANKGEGIAFGQPAGALNLANAGGGGACHNAGGGGGGLGGRGGLGGKTSLSDGDGRAAPAGQGGDDVVFQPSERLIMGGGGGAGEANDGLVASGGAGGGIVWIRASEIEGPGAIRANGAGGGPNTASGAGGGGAGGVVRVEAFGSLACTEISARGGAGGNVDGITSGPGGGGGGGVVAITAKSIACKTNVARGAGGVLGSNQDAWGATDGADGLVK